LARPAIAEYRITNYDGQQVTFWYEDHESEQQQTKTMKVQAFIERLIAHITPKQCKLVRRFGLYARRAKGRLQQAIAACRGATSLRLLHPGEEVIELAPAADQVLRERSVTVSALWNRTGAVSPLAPAVRIHL
jgi:hypothetical protein